MWPAAVFCLTIALQLGQASAQVVQLPSFQTFSYSGSVLVPDRGTASLGGTARSSSFSSRRGFGANNRNFGNAASQSNLSISATIIDHDAIDKQILGQPTGENHLARDSHAHPASASKPSTQNTSTRKTSKPKPAAMIQEGKSLVRYARARYAAGDHEMAKVGYQMAIAKLDGHLLDYALAEYRSRF